MVPSKFLPKPKTYYGYVETGTLLTSLATMVGFLTPHNACESVCGRLGVPLGSSRSYPAAPTTTYTLPQISGYVLIALRSIGLSQCA